MVLMVDKLNNVCYIWYNNQKAPPAGKAGGGTEDNQLLLRDLLIYSLNSSSVRRYVKLYTSL